jgi:hypothetical protein
MGERHWARLAAAVLLAFSISLLSYSLGWQQGHDASMTGFDDELGRLSRLFEPPENSTSPPDKACDVQCADDEAS